MPLYNGFSKRKSVGRKCDSKRDGKDRHTCTNTLFLKWCMTFVNVKLLNAKKYEKPIIFAFEIFKTKLTLKPNNYKKSYVRFEYPALLTCVHRRQKRGKFKSNIG